MKFIKGRVNFLKESSESGAFGNDIEWGDSLIGRLISSTNNKLKSKLKTKKINKIIDRLGYEFDEVLSKSIEHSSEDSTIIFIKLSSLLGELKSMVENESDIEDIKTLTDNIIKFLRENDFSKGEYKIEQSDKKELEEELNMFYVYLKSIKKDDEESNNELSDSDIEKRKNNYTKLADSLINLFSEIDRLSSIKRNEEEIEENKKNVDYVYKRIIEFINKERPKGRKFKNDLLYNSKDVSWKLIEKKRDSIIYRKEKELVKVSDNKLFLNIPDYDSEDEIFKGKETYKQIDFTESNINLVAGYISSNLTEIDKIVNGKINLKLNQKEVDWFNENIKGKIGVISSKNNLLYKSEIGKIDKNGRINLLEPKVKSQGPMGINRLVKRSIVLNNNKEASKYINSLSNHKVTSESLGLSINENKANDYSLIDMIRRVKSNGLGIRTIEKSIEKSKDNDFIKSIFNNINKNFSKNNPLLDNQDNINLETEEGIVLFSNYIANIANISKKSKELDYGSLYEYIKDFNENFINFSEDILENINNLTNYLSFIKEERKSVNKIESYFKENINIDNFTISKEDVEKLKKETESKKKDIKNITTDNIIEIVKLFNKAYKTYTTNNIPSGRSNGKVSNKTFNKYTNLGGSNGTPSNPGYGPWRNDKMFSKFESGVMDIIKDENYKKIFHKDTPMIMGDGTKKKGGGKILFEFINKMLSGDRYYKDDIQRNLLNDYFGITPKKSEIDETEKGKLSSSQLAKKVKEKPILEFKKISDFLIKQGSVYVIESNNLHYYLLGVYKRGDYTYFKMSRSFKDFYSYFSKDYNIKKGELDTMRKNNQGLIFGAFLSDVKIERGTSINIDFIDLKEYSNDPINVETKDMDINNIQGLYELHNEKGAFKSKETMVSFNKNDTTNYSKLTNIL